MSKSRPSQGLIDMMNGQWEKLQEERSKSISCEPVYKKPLPTEELQKLSDNVVKENGLDNFFDEDEIIIIKQYWRDGFDYAVKNFI